MCSPLRALANEDKAPLLSVAEAKLAIFSTLSIIWILCPDDYAYPRPWIDLISGDITAIYHGRAFDLYDGISGRSYKAGNW